MKKLISMVVCVVLFISVFSVSVCASESGKCGDNAFWEFEGDTLTISGSGVIDRFYYTQVSAVLNESGFWSLGDKIIKKVVINEGITSIDQNAFSFMVDLESVYIPASMSAIGSGAFLGCDNLKTVNYTGSKDRWSRISIGRENDSISYNGKNNSNTMFVYNNNDTFSTEIIKDENYTYSVSQNDVVIVSADNLSFRLSPNVVIDDNMFNGGNIKEIHQDVIDKDIIIPDSFRGKPIIGIGDYAFHHCNRIKTVTIPDSIKYIGTEAFQQCNLEEINFGKGVEYIGEKAFQFLRAKNLDIPDSVKMIANDAFCGSAVLENVKIGSGIKIIGNNAFAQCEQLSNINILSCEQIRDGAFSNSGIKNISLPENLKIIGSWAIPGLTSVTLPRSLIMIGVSNFTTPLEIVYSGNEIEWKNVFICANNEGLTQSSIKFNKETKDIESNISVVLNGIQVNFDQPPIIVHGRTLVPLRAIFEALGATVYWYEEYQEVEAWKNDICVAIGIGQPGMNVNGEIIPLDVPAQLVNGRTLVPARAISEAFGCDVKWEESTQTVIITQ